MAIISTSKVAGLQIYAKPCPRCGGRMYVKACPCAIRRRGWRLCAQCLNPKCLTMIKVKKR